MDAKCLTPSKRRTDRRRESNLANFCLNMRHLVAIILMNFLIINWPNFVYLLVDPVFYLPPLNFFEASRFVLPHRMDPRDRHNEQTNERMNGWTKRRVCSSVRPSLRWSLTLRPAGPACWKLSTVPYITFNATYNAVSEGLEYPVNYRDYNCDEK